MKSNYDNRQSNYDKSQSSNERTRSNNDNSDLRKKFAPQDQRLLIHISNFRPVKRVTDVIEIFDRVSQRIPARLLMVGDGPERSNAEWLVRNKRLASQVFFLGKQESVAEILSIADLMLLPSENESFGLVALEAMACEVPVIASNVGGIPEVIRDGQHGYLCQPRDVNSMAQKAISILADNEKRRAMGINARQSAQDNFCSTAIIRRYEDYYETVIDQVHANQR